jgi:hypothetical protein
MGLHRPRYRRRVYEGTSLVILQNRFRPDSVAINLRQRFPIEAGRVLNRAYLRLRPTVEHDIQAVVIAQALGRFVLN